MSPERDQKPDIHTDREREINMTEKKKKRFELDLGFPAKPSVTG